MHEDVRSVVAMHGQDFHLTSSPVNNLLFYLILFGCKYIHMYVLSNYISHTYLKPQCTSPDQVPRQTLSFRIQNAAKIIAGNICI